MIHHQDSETNKMLRMLKGLKYEVIICQMLIYLKNIFGVKIKQISPKTSKNMCGASNYSAKCSN